MRQIAALSAHHCPGPCAAFRSLLSLSTAGQPIAFEGPGMKVISIKVEEPLLRRLKVRAAAANLTISEFVRPLLEEAAWPGGRYVFTGQDELLGIAIQTFTMVSELTGDQSPALLERALLEARRLMRERGLLEGEIVPLSGEGEGSQASRTRRS
jgi:hypothetical protein